MNENTATATGGNAAARKLKRRSSSSIPGGDRNDDEDLRFAVTTNKANARHCLGKWVLCTAAEVLERSEEVGGGMTAFLYSRSLRKSLLLNSEKWGEEDQVLFLSLIHI